MRRGLIGLLLVASVAVSAAQDGPTILGAWRLNTELSTPPPAPPGEGWPRERPPEGGRSTDDGPPTGGRPHSSPPGAVFGGMGGVPGLGRGPSSDEDLRRASVIRRRLSEGPSSLVIAREGSRFTLTDGDGRSVAYVASGRKEERFTGDGELTSKAHIEGPALVLEEDFGGGVRLTTKYLPLASEGHERLEVTLEAAGLPKPRTRNGSAPALPPMNRATRVYERNTGTDDATAAGRSSARRR